MEQQRGTSSADPSGSVEVGQAIEDEMEPGDDLGEIPPTRARKQPAVPSAQEVEEHEVTHLP